MGGIKTIGLNCPVDPHPTTDLSLLHKDRCVFALLNVYYVTLMHHFPPELAIHDLVNTYC